MPREFESHSVRVPVVKLVNTRNLKFRAERLAGSIPAGHTNQPKRKSAMQEEFEDQAFVVEAGTVIEFYGNGSVYIRRRLSDSLIVQRLTFVDEKWHMLTRQDLDADAPVIEVGFSIQKK